MAHPTCAPAHLPTPTRAGDDAFPSSPPGTLPAAFVTREMNGLHHTSRILDCLHRLIETALKVEARQREITHGEIQLLIQFVADDFFRRSASLHAVALARQS